MNRPFFTLLLSSSFSLIAAPRGGDLTIPLQETRAQVEHLTYQFNGQKVEMDILQDKIGSLQQEIDNLREQLSQQSLKEREGLKDQLNTNDRRLTLIEKAQETLISDLKQIKNLVNDSALQLSNSEKQINNLDKQLSQDVKTLKKAVETLMTIVQKGNKASIPTATEEVVERSGERIYRVKPGDSLSKIALDHHVDLKTLKELNQLSSDKITVGQKILLP